MKIVALFPLSGNGGIASWARKFIDTFPDDKHIVLPIDIAPANRQKSSSFFWRLLTGYKALYRIKTKLLELLIREKVDILHTTSSGNIGSYRDIVVAKICRKYGVKSILHCHYGCITDNLNSKGLISILLRKSLLLYDQIWVLDQKSYNSLIRIPRVSSKVYLTPNSIEVEECINVNPKTYDKVAFIGNLIPTKGVYELVKACTIADVHLDIVGPGSTKVIDQIKLIAGEKSGKSIIYHGRLSNLEAVNLMKTVDIVALPTYYPSEAFPISIIEAMSIGKLVISCPRAAIQDMLTGLDGTPCGILIRPRSVDEIVDAIKWSQANSKEADLMCRKAYEKVYSSYRKDIVYDIYRENYNRLVES